MSASCRVVLGTTHENNETRNIKNFEDGDFPALRPSYNRQAHAHHICHNKYAKFHLWEDNTEGADMIKSLNYPASF